MCLAQKWIKIYDFDFSFVFIRYDGDFFQGAIHGDGIMNYPAESVNARYEGKFVTGMFSGHGELKWKDGRRYEGNFVQGQVHGVGVMTFREGDLYTHARYEGHFVKGKFSGKGWKKNPKRNFSVAPGDAKF